VIKIKNRIICFFIICSFIFLLIGCGSKESNSESAYIEDIKISQSSEYFSNDAILIKSFNGFKCIDTDIEYNEELGVYTCTVKFKKIIDK
jgi:hypothetical protein